MSLCLSVADGSCGQVAIKEEGQVNDDEQTGGQGTWFQRLVAFYEYYTLVVYSNGYRYRYICESEISGYRVCLYNVCPSILLCSVGKYRQINLFKLSNASIAL